MNMMKINGLIRWTLKCSRRFSPPNPASQKAFETGVITGALLGGNEIPPKTVPFPKESHSFYPQASGKI